MNLIVNVSVFCEILTMTLGSTTITSPTHFLANSPPQTPPGDTTIPVPSVTWTPAACPVTLTIVTIDTATNTTPGWLVDYKTISTNDVALMNTYSLKTQFSMVASGFILVKSTVTMQQISFSQILVDCTLVSITQSSTPAWDAFYWLDDIQRWKLTPKWQVNIAATAALAPKCPAYPFTVTLTRTDADPSIPGLFDNKVADQTTTPQIGVKSKDAAKAGSYNFRVTATVTGSSPVMKDEYNVPIYICALQVITAPNSATIL